MKLEHLATATGFIIQWTCILLAACVLSFGLYHFGVSLKLAAIAKAEGDTWTAYQNKEAERWKALQANIKLEEKRTTVQNAIRQMVIAEYRRCVKGRCK